MSKAQSYVNERDPMTGGWPGDRGGPEVWARHIIGQLNPNDEERFRMAHGRHISGLGDYGGDQAYEGEELRQLEKADDVYGSGVFDPVGRAPTVHPDLGIFGASYDLPGYIEREVQFAPSTEIEGWPSGAEVVIVPGGGLMYSRSTGRHTPRLGKPSGGTNYVEVGPGTMIGEVNTRAGELVSQRVRGPDTVLPGGVELVNTRDVADRLLPVAQGPGRQVPVTRKAPTQIPVTAVTPTGATRRVGNAAPVGRGRPRYGASWPWPVEQALYFEGVGLGADDQPAGWGTYLVAGAIAGVAAALFVGTLKMREAR